MSGGIKSWLADIKIEDPVKRRQAALLQNILLVLTAAGVLSLPLILFASIDVAVMALYASGLVLGVVCYQTALWQLRRGNFGVAVGLMLTGLLLVQFMFACSQGLSRNASSAISLALPITFAGLVLGRRGLLAVVLVSSAAVVAICVAETIPGSGVGFAYQESSPPAVAVGIVFIIALVAVVLDRFGAALRLALHETREREQELATLHAGLEASVAARTAELQATVDQLQASQATIRELGAPVLPVLPGVLVAPLIGVLDTARAADLSAAVLQAIDRTRARHLILDITGVPVVDTHVARALLRVAQAAQLLGAEVMLVGVRAEVAQTMVTLGVSLGGIRVYPNLQEAIASHVGAA